MTDRVCFGAAVQPLVRGRATCRILRLPADVARSFAAFGARRAGGEIAGHPVNLALSRAPEGDGLLLWVGKGLPDRLGAKPGPRLDLRLRAAAPDAADAPADLQNALRRTDRGLAAPDTGEEAGGALPDRHRPDRSDPRQI